MRDEWGTKGKRDDAWRQNLAGWNEWGEDVRINDGGLTMKD